MVTQTEEGQRDKMEEKSRSKLTSVVLKLVDNFKIARGVFLALGVAIFSTALNILTYEAGETIHPIGVTLWISTTVILLSIIVLLIAHPAFPRSVHTVSYLVVASLFTGCGSMSLLVGVAIYEPADVVSLLFTMPVILIVFDGVIKKQMPKIMHIVFTICSIIGVVCVTKPPFLFNRMASDFNNWGIFFGLLSAFLHAGGLVTMRELAGNYIYPVILCIGTAITIWAVSFTASFFIVGSHIFPSYVRVCLVLMAAGACHFGACTFVYLALATERPFVVSIIMTLEVALTFVAQWFVLNIDPNWYAAIGGFLITVACIGVALTRQEDDRSINEGINEQEGEPCNNNEYELNHVGERELLLHEYSKNKQTSGD